jgi:hypothetical protein
MARAVVAGPVPAGLEAYEVVALDVDLYSITALTEAMRGAALAVFALQGPPHSAGLSQGQPRDLLTLAADTFARAAGRAGVPRLGDATGDAELHAVLAAHGVPVQRCEVPIGALAVPVRAQVSARHVHSVQRLPVPPGRDAAWLMQTYVTWLLPWVPRWLLRAERTGELVQFLMLWDTLAILVLQRDAGVCEPDREVWTVIGGQLARTEPRAARLEFRMLPGGAEALVALHDFTPRLPWWLYRATQAVVHGWTMAWFGRYLRHR